MKIESQIMGKGKGAAKALAGYAPIFQHLASEHGEVAAMMMRIANSKDIETREKLFPELRRNLLSHAHGEEKEFYPQLQKLSALEGLVMQCLSDHKEIEAHLEQLHTADKSTDAWMALFKQMKDIVEAHVHREEDELFPQANDRLDREQASMIQDRYERAEEQEKRVM